MAGMKAGLLAENKVPIFIMNRAGNKLSRNVVVSNTLGLHARAAAKIAKCVQDCKSKVWIIKGDLRADAASIIDVLTLGCEKGTQITIEISDPSDMKILEDLAELVQSGFGE